MAAMTYAEAVRTLNASDVQADISEACQKLAKTTVKMMQEFDHIAAQLHTIDLQGQSAPLLPQWNVLRQNYREVVWQFRTNAGLISGRLKLFCSLILPLATRNITGGSSRNHQEKLQVLQSFMGVSLPRTPLVASIHLFQIKVSSDHAALTRSLAENVLKLNSSLSGFHTGFTRFAASRVSSGQTELRNLRHKISELETELKQLYIGVGRLVGVEVGFLVYSTFRTIISASRSGRNKVSRHRLALHGSDAIAVGRLYEQLDRTHNEVAHADYAAQVSHRRNDSVTTSRAAVSSLASDQMMAIQGSLGLFLAIWSRLQTDCTEILRWVQTTHSPNDLPPSLTVYLQGGQTFYSTLAQSLDAFVSAIDPSLFA
ncbi:hypothetical protein HGRIS_012446 [Hohenbuehelia grisea]|uniref:Fungal N-terminal domain-containing protein n=1 Tax=Hohenbuehelia grisea TaxID=104357 RepID=A0ABR3ISD9_9AGAR